MLIALLYVSIGVGTLGIFAVLAGAVMLGEKHQVCVFILILALQVANTAFAHYGLDYAIWNGFAPRHSDWELETRSHLRFVVVGQYVDLVLAPLIFAFFWWNAGQKNTGSEDE